MAPSAAQMRMPPLGWTQPAPLVCPCWALLNQCRAAAGFDQTCAGARLDKHRAPVSGKQAPAPAACVLCGPALLLLQLSCCMQPGVASARGCSWQPRGREWASQNGTGRLACFAPLGGPGQQRQLWGPCNSLALCADSFRLCCCLREDWCSPRLEGTAGSHSAKSSAGAVRHPSYALSSWQRPLGGPSHWCDCAKAL